MLPISEINPPIIARFKNITFFPNLFFQSATSDLLNSPNLKLFINSASISTMVITPNLGTICSCNPSHLLLLYIIPVLISN